MTCHASYYKGTVNNDKKPFCIIRQQGSEIYTGMDLLQKSSPRQLLQSAGLRQALRDNVVVVGMGVAIAVAVGGHTCYA